jgi:hypothetical protein
LGGKRLVRFVIWGKSQKSPPPWPIIRDHGLTLWIFGSLAVVEMVFWNFTFESDSETSLIDGLPNCW